MFLLFNISVGNLLKNSEHLQLWKRRAQVLGFGRHKEKIQKDKVFEHYVGVNEDVFWINLRAEPIFVVIINLLITRFRRQAHAQSSRHLPKHG